MLRLGSSLTALGQAQEGVLGGTCHRSAPPRAVWRSRLSPTPMPTRKSRHRELVTVVGHAAAVSAGERITATGEWFNDRTHGQQFKTRFLKTSAPTSVEGIERYLASGMIRGIG